jgi:hypothetical protein
MFGRFNAVTLVLILLVSISSIIFTQQSASASATPTVQWSNTYSPTQGLSIAKTFDNGYIIAGINRHGWHDGMTFTTTVIKTSASGGTEWSKQFGDEFSGPFFKVSITNTSDKGYLLSTPINQLIKIDSQGKIQWTAKVYGGNVIEVNDGYVVAGFSLGSRLFSNVTKMDFDGNVLWVKGFESAAEDGVVFRAFALTGDNNFAFAGNWGNSLWFGVADKSGNLFVNKTYLPYGSSAYFLSLSKTIDGGFILCGHNCYGNAVLYKVDNRGNLEWNQTYSQYTFSSVIQTQNSEYVVVGANYVPQESMLASAMAAVIVKTNASGFQQWFVNYTTKDIASKIIATSEGGFAITGSKNDQIWLTKFNFIDVPSETPSPSPSVPELSWLAILPLILSMLAFAVMLRYRKLCTKP